MPDPISADLSALAERPDVAAAVAYLHEHNGQTLDVQVELSEIAAPPFGERARGARIAELFAQAGLRAIETDDIGNVVGRYHGPATPGPVAVTAHLDTVFPAGTDVTVRREGGVLRGPGISDDARGLATLVALARALRSARVDTRRPLFFAATVGEEGAGDLRGVKRLFARDGALRDAEAFVSLDGAGMERIVARGLGSLRFRITIRGPGGHSWVDWGTPNPAHALAQIGARLVALDLPAEPKTTLTVARIGGGTSINAIPQEAWLEVDTRSADPDALAGLGAALDRAVHEVIAGQPELRADVRSIGERPGGQTDPECHLVRAAEAATRLLGYEPHLGLSSTDANVPMSLGVPAITLGCGGEAGKAHTPEEWYDDTDGVDGLVRALYTLLLVAES